MQLMRFLGKIAKTTLAIGALTVSAFAAAEEVYPYYHHDMAFGGAPYCAPSCAPSCGPSCGTGCCCGQPCEPPPACNWGYNPPAYLRCAGACCNEGGFWDGLGFRVDFLWWRPSTDIITGVGIETTILPTIDSTSSLIQTTHEKRPNFRFEPGFRIGIAHICPCECSFDVMLNWTHLHSKAQSQGFSVNVPAGAESGDFTLFASNFERIIEAYPDVSTNHWKMDLDLLDLEFGYKYYVCPCIAFRPFVGLRGARINQHLRVFSFADRSPTDYSPDIFTSFSRVRNNFLAIGPRAGFDLELDLGCGLSIVGCVAESLLFGRFERHGREHYTSFTTSSTAEELEYFAHGRTKRDSVLANDVAVGLRWAHCFTWCNRCHPVSLSFLWEHHHFKDLTDFNFYASGLEDDLSDRDDPGHRQPISDLYLQGLTVAFEIGF